MVRYKYRYLVFSLDYGQDNTVDTSVTQEDFERRIRAAVEIHFGPHGLGLVLSNFSVRYFSSFTGIGVARVGRDYYRTLWGALSLITGLGGAHKCRLLVLNCSGTIRKSQIAALKHDRARLAVALHRLQSQGSGAASVVDKIAAENEALIRTMDMA
ncbi:RNA-binding protein pop5 [Blastocladiella emersonii ATCC 22665]|nr:RNA-binding protein pop5 [Blastocladiella emersonii ATCC 22665]